MPARAVYRLALAISVAAISFLAFAPLTAEALPSNDKLNHIIAFAVLAWLAERSYPGPTLALPRWGLLVFYGLLIEVVQYYLPYRHFSVLDFAADVVGVLSYVVLAYLLGRFWLSGRPLQPSGAAKESANHGNH